MLHLEHNKKRFDKKMVWDELSLKLRLAKQARKNKKNNLNNFASFEVPEKKNMNETAFVPFKMSQSQVQQNLDETTLC